MIAPLCSSSFISNSSEHDSGGDALHVYSAQKSWGRSACQLPACRAPCEVSRCTTSRPGPRLRATQTAPAVSSEPHHQSPSSFALRPFIAACRCLSASANPPAMLPPLSRAPASALLAPLPAYPLSRAAGAGGAVFLAAGRLAGGAGGTGFAREPPLAAGRGGAGGAGGAAGGGRLLTTSSRYADGAQPEAD